jgi:hypothetical protein
MEGAIYSEELECPNCENSGDDCPYMLDGEKYPKISNEYKGYNGMGDTHDWTELHKCKNCGTKYWLETGI